MKEVEKQKIINKFSGNKIKRAKKRNGKEKELENTESEIKFKLIIFFST